VTGRSDALATLREPNFRAYFLSTLVNGAGSTMGSIALVFAVLEVSSSPSALGIVLAAETIPQVVLMLAGGVIADRFGRTATIQLSNVVSGLTALAIAVLVISGDAELWQLAALSVVNGAAAC
jgi:MFS family permease